MTLAGRNDPCPCGSGRKYKHCCLGSTIPLAGRYTQAERNRALTALMLFCAREFPHDEAAAAILLWGAAPPNGATADQFEDLIESETGQSAFRTWFMFDLKIERGRTPLDFFLEQKGPCTNGETAYLELMRSSHLRLYEVLAVRPDEGFTLKDLWTDHEIVVRERLATRQLVRWDLIGARVVEGPRGDLVFEAVPYAYPPSLKEMLLKELRRAHREFRKRTPGGDLVMFFRRSLLLLHRTWLSHVALPPPLRIVTSEGDPVALARVVFDVRDEALVLGALERHPGFERASRSRLSWFEEDGDSRRSLGSIELKDGRLTLETMSRERAERGRAVIEGAAGALVRYRATRLEELDQALARRRAAPQGRNRARRPSSGLSPAEEAEVLREFYDRHYRDWLDHPLPALGNRTPRHAVRLKTVRPMLLALLKEMESRGERERQGGRPSYDTGWLWEELGVARGPS
jgi:hypothetical protein